MAWFCALFMVIVSVLTFKTGLDDANPAMQKEISLRSAGQQVTIDTTDGPASVDFGLQVKLSYYFLMTRLSAMVCV